MQTADDHMEDRLKESIKEYPLEQPDAGFTDRFMDQLEQEILQNPVSSYSPLISIRSGILITVICSFLVFVIASLELPQSLISLQWLDLISVEWEAWDQITAKIGTSIMIYAMIFLIVGLGIQFQFLKRWHARQMVST